MKVPQNRICLRRLWHPFCTISITTFCCYTVRLYGEKKSGQRLWSSIVFVVTTWILLTNCVWNIILPKNVTSSSRAARLALSKAEHPRRMRNLHKQQLYFLHPSSLFRPGPCHQNSKHGEKSDVQKSSFMKCTLVLYLANHIKRQILQGRFKGIYLI